MNASLPYFFRKREGQLYFQTWHGSPLKRIAHDRPHLDFFNWHHRRQLLVARDGWDYLLSQSDFCTRALCSAFRYDGPADGARLPPQRLCSAPTTRTPYAAAPGGPWASPTTGTSSSTHRPGATTSGWEGYSEGALPGPRQVVDGLDDAVVLVRGHYNSVRAAEERDPGNRVIDVTRYPDIADLYVAADAMVTDYSSVFFDFVLTDKPMVFLAPDLTEYRDDNRGFYLDYTSTVPGPVCLTTSEVVKSCAHRTPLRGARRSGAEFTPHDDGKAAARVIDAILGAHPYR